MRNLQLEIRQVREGQRESSDVLAQGQVILQRGNVGGNVNINAQQGSGQGRSSLSQTALVLNGRAVSFSLGQTVPLRVVQTFVRQGQLSVVPSTVLIERASGFSARPIWRSGEDAEIEISTQLAQRGSSESAATSTTIVLPLQQWVTIAESSDEASQNSSGILSAGQQSSSQKLQVQMRLTVK